jgi:hypothetical protein
MTVSLYALDFIQLAMAAVLRSKRLSGRATGLARRRRITEKRKHSKNPKPRS